MTGNKHELNFDALVSSIQEVYDHLAAQAAVVRWGWFLEGFING